MGPSRHANYCPWFIDDQRAETDQHPLLEISRVLQDHALYSTPSENKLTAETEHPAKNESSL